MVEACLPHIMEKAGLLFNVGNPIRKLEWSGLVSLPEDLKLNVKDDTSVIYSSLPSSI